MDKHNGGKPQQSGEVGKASSAKSRVLWSFAFVLIAGLTVWMVTSQTRSFSFSAFLDFLKGADLRYIAAAILSMLGFIIFEAAAIKCINKAFGYRHSLRSGAVYSSADIYFSAITPSATGGQPVSGMFMVRDGIPAATATATLLINLAMYSFSILVIGIFSLIIHFNVFFDYFGTVSKLLISFGFVIQVLLTLFILMLIFGERLLHGMCRSAIKLLGRLHLIRRVDKKLQKLDCSMTEYRACIEMIKDAGALPQLIKAFAFNLLQRISQISVTMFAFLAVGNSFSLADEIWSMQNFVVIGSYCAPIPGAMGVADLLLLDGFGKLMTPDAAANLELLSRAASFYLCTVLCGVTVLIDFLIGKARRRVK